MANYDTIKTIVAKRDDSVEHTMVAKTGSDAPDIIVSPMHPFLIMGVRSARVYMQCMLGILTTAGMGADKGMLPNEFAPLVWVALQMSLAPAVFSLLWNAGELLARIDEKFPKLRA